MELDGLLLDEEGTFSLSGFQEFTVSAPRRTPGGARCSWPNPSPAPHLRRPLGRSLLKPGPRRAPCGRTPGPLVELLGALPGLSCP